MRAGGNAVDAAVASVIASFVAESPLTGLGAGGYMLVHAPDRGEDVLLDFFVEVPGRGGAERGAELVPIPVYFTEGSPRSSTSAPPRAGFRERRRDSSGRLSCSARRRWRNWSGLR